MTRPDPAKPRPKLTAEYRLVLTFGNGWVTVFRHDTREEAEDAALRLARRDSKSTWAIERRMVSDWLPIPTPVAVQWANDGAHNDAQRDRQVRS